MGRTFEALKKYEKERKTAAVDLGKNEKSNYRLNERKSKRMVTQANGSNLNDEIKLSNDFSKLKEVISDSQQHVSNGSSKVQYDSKNFDDKMISIFKPNSFEAEQFKMLRTHVLFPNSAKSPRSILVSSTAPGDGKTFVAANLAITVSLSINRHVLLIDCDFRQPKVHRCFGIGQVPGLSDYLSKEKTLPELLLKTNLDRLAILSAGQTPPNPSELISSKRMSLFLKEVVERYNDRLIILDSPPPLLTAEANVLARYVDGIILVANYRETRRADFEDLINKLGRKKIIGIFMNNVNFRILRYFVSKKYCRYNPYYSKNI